MPILPDSHATTSNSCPAGIGVTHNGFVFGVLFFVFIDVYLVDLFLRF